MSVQNNGQRIIKGNRNKKNGIWGVPLETQQPAAVINNILVQKSKNRTSTLLSCSTVPPTYKKSHQGHQTRFPEDVASPDLKTNQEAYGKIK